MSFLSPWFLLGAVAIAGPIIFHLIRKATRNRVQFSTTQFLSASPTQLQKKSNLQHPWLLLLRCLIIALLTFGFSRPFLKSDVPILTENTREQHTVLILDESASMRRDGQWDAAKSQLINWIETTGTNHRLSILGVSDQVSHIVSNELWDKTPTAERLPLIRGLLDNRAPGWGGTFLDAGIDAALDELEQLAENTGTDAKRTIRVFSDLTLGSRLSGLAGRDWPEKCAVEFDPTVGGETKNAGLQWLGWSKIGEGPRNARLSLITTGENQTITLTARDAITGNTIGEPQTVYSQVGYKRLFLMAIPNEQTNPFTIELSGDAESLDNRLYVAPKQIREATLPFIGLQAADDPKASRFYMERAVVGWTDPKVSIASATSNWARDPKNLLLIGATPSDDEATQVKAFLDEGGTALLLLTDRSQLPLIESLSGESGWQHTALSRNYGLLGTIDFEHPVFKIFADPRYNNFTNIRFWQAQPLTAPANTNARILAKFDEGPAAIVEWKVGKGTLIAWAGDWTPQASQWVLSSKFVPWFQELIESSLGGPALPTMAFVQEANRLTNNREVTWQTLDGENLQEDTLKSPGIYQIKADTSSHWVALNIPHEESRIDPLPFDTWEKLGVPLEASPLIVSQEISEQQAAVKNAIELEGEQKLWRWLLVGVALFLAIESLLSIKISRRGLATAEA